MKTEYIEKRFFTGESRFDALDAPQSETTKPVNNEERKKNSN